MKTLQPHRQLLLGALCLSLCYTVSAWALCTEQPGLPQAHSGVDLSIAELSRDEPHTIKDLQHYLRDNLSDELADRANDAQLTFIIAVGDGAQASTLLCSYGWETMSTVSKRIGFHQVLRMRHPQHGQGYAITRVNGNDRVLHIQSLLTLAGVAPAHIETIGSVHRWQTSYLKTFARLGYIPDAVFYGFPGTIALAILQGAPIRNLRHLYTFMEYKRQRLGNLGIPMHELVFANGKRAWVFQNIYGDLAEDLLQSLVVYGVRTIVVTGTAGALTSKFHVDELFTPAEWIDNGIVHSLEHLPLLPGIPRKGAYQRVSTPNIETKAWAASASAHGVDVIEIELGYFLRLLTQHPEIHGQVALVISDVLTGPNHRDMTEWGNSNLNKLLAPFRKMVAEVLGLRGRGDFVLSGYHVLPLIEELVTPS